MGELDQMLRSWGSLSMICHWSRTDWEQILPFIQYGVITERTFVGPDAMVVLWRRVSREGFGGGLWRCCGWWCLMGIFWQGEILQGNRVLFVVNCVICMRRLYRRDCEKTILPFHLSEWLEWKCRSAAQSVDFLYSVVDNLRSARIWIFMSSKYIWVCTGIYTGTYQQEKMLRYNNRLKEYTQFRCHLDSEVIQNHLPMSLKVFEAITKKFSFL